MTYYLLKFYTRIIQLFPLRFHYFFSDLLFPLIYHIIRYRRKVVKMNLANSFPDKTAAERNIIERKYYHHLCDTIIETFYFDHVGEKEIKKRLTFSNPELVNKYLEQGRQVMLVMGHYNNWEWNCSWPLHYNKYKSYVIYRRLNDKNFNRFYFELRSRFGIIPLETAETFKHLYKNASNNIPSASAFLMDQRPKIYELNYWTNFLNQDTPVLTGTEKLARRLDTVVIYGVIKKIKRGYNRIDLTLIAEHAKDTAPFELTEKAIRMLEETIIEQPELWLWSHKRWKHKRIVSN